MHADVVDKQTHVIIIFALRLFPVITAAEHFEFILITKIRSNWYLIYIFAVRNVPTLII